jgi:peptide/nickel transport system permease protein
MLNYIAQRLILMIGILFGVLTITFFLSRVLPASPANLILGDRPTAEQVAVAEEELGLNKPLLVQYALYMGKIAQGDFGNSLRTNQPVLVEIRNRMGATLELTTLAIIIVIVVGVPLGVLSAVRQNSWIDNLARAGAVGGVAIPAFMLAMILQIIFYGQLNWLPIQGRMDSILLLDVKIPQITRLFLIDTLLAGEWQAFKSSVSHIILPTLTLAIVTLASVTRITRNMMVEVLSEEFIRTAFAYGLPRRAIYYRYALKATLIPMLTVVGLTYGYLLGGAVVVEFVFDWPGLGGFLVFSIVQNDFPAVLGTTLFLAATYLTINLIVDLLYFAVDPRLRAQ